MNRSFLRITTIFFIAALILSSCTFTELFDHSILDKPDESENEPSKEVLPVRLTVARYSGEQISPYRSESRANRDIISLCYDALIKIDSTLNAVPQICESFEILGKKVVFHIREDAVFSDGSRISASDCVYSFARAENSQSVFHNRFSLISGYEDNDANTFTVYFVNDNLYNVNLTSIPIIKAGTDVAGIAIGSGEYVFNSDEGGMFLTVNKYAKVTPATERIDLLPVKNSEELLYNVNYNNIHLSYADLSGGNSSFRSTIEIKDFTTNNLIFAVVNKNKEYFAEKDAVRGLTYAINRDQIVSTILSSSSRSAWYPFNPDWCVTAAADLNENIYSSTTAHEYFTNAGLSLAGTQRVWRGASAELVILVNQESIIKTEVAEIIAKNLESLGFSTTVRTLKWDEMQQTVMDGEYDIFIGEMNIFPNMDISPILNNELVLSATTATKEGEHFHSEEFLSAVSDFYSGQMDMRSFLSIFQEELPFIPIYFSGGALAINRNVSGQFDPNYFNLYSSPETWILE